MVDVLHLMLVPNVEKIKLIREEFNRRSLFCCGMSSIGFLVLEV